MLKSRRSSTLAASTTSTDPLQSNDGSLAETLFQNASFVFFGLAAGVIINACSQGCDYICYHVPLLHPLLSIRKKSDVVFNRKNAEIRRALATKADKTVEVCASDIESVLEAIEGGATSLELCSDRPQGGITPSLALIEEAVKHVAGTDVLVHVLIRPRPGGFVYSSAEFDLMVRDVLTAKEAGAHGVVVGVLTPAGDIDLARLRTLRAVAGEGMVLTFHRAFDVSSGDALQELEQLVRVGCDRLLTSGKSACAMDRDGTALLAKLCLASSTMGMQCNASDCVTLGSLRSAPYDASISFDQTPTPPAPPEEGDRLEAHDAPSASATDKEFVKSADRRGTFAKLFSRLTSSTASVSVNDPCASTRSVLGDQPTVDEPTVPEVSASMRQQAAVNVAEARLGPLTIVAACGIKEGPELVEFLATTGIRAIHAGSSVTEVKPQLPSLTPSGTRASNDEEGKIPAAGWAPPVHMGAAHADDTTAFSCATAPKVHALVSLAASSWAALDAAAMQREEGRLLTDRVLADHLFAEIDGSASDVSPLQEVERGASAMSNSDEETYEEAREV